MANIIRVINILQFLLLLVNSHALVVTRQKNPESGYSAWDIIHLEHAIQHGILPDFSKFPASQNSHSHKRSQAVYHKDQFKGIGDKMLQSSPGCPEPFEGAPWVYSLAGEEPQPKCYLAGFQGPCPPNMKLYPQSSSYYGYCDCSCKQYFGHKVNVPRTYCIGPGNRQSSVLSGKGNVNGLMEYSNRILAFDKESNACQILFEQGRCEAHQWMVFGDDPTQGLICEGRQCPQADGQDFSFYDFKTKKCHQLGEECAGGNGELVNINDTYDATSSFASTSLERDNNWVRHSYQLQEYNWMPDCQIDASYEEIQYRYYGNRIQPFECKTYERYSRLLERCVPMFKKRFGLG